MTETGPDFQRLYVAHGHALWAIERNVLADFWPAYDRMHLAAGLGPMDWKARPSLKAYAAAEVGSAYTGGKLRLQKLVETLSVLARNIDAVDVLRHWADADQIIRGARRIHAWGLHSQLTALEDRMLKRRGDQSSWALQSNAEDAAEYDRVERTYKAEMTVMGLGQSTTEVAR